MRATRPDLVHTTLFEADVSGRVAARLTGIPVVSSLVSETYGVAHTAEPGIRRWRLRGAQLLDGTTARLACRLHAVSAHVAETMARRLRYPRARIDVIPRGRDPKALGLPTAARRAAARAMLGGDGETRLVVAAARHETPKGLDVLMEAFAELHRRIPEARLVVAGSEGSVTPELRAAVHDLGLQASVALLGPRDDVADLLCAADVVVLPSRREGFPGVLVEAMALEAPIVASDLPQVREVVADDCAVLFPPEDAARLSDALAEVLQGRTDTATRVARARHRFEERFTIDRIASAMVAFYQRAVSTDHVPAPARIVDR
jgi:glycosyltransferase involved in cell wall biosynthesis